VVRSATKVGHVAQQAIGRLAGSGTGQAAEEATEQVRQAAEEAVQQVGQAAAKATEQVGQAAVEASGKASFTPKNSDEAARSGGQQRRSASRRSGDGKTTRGSKRGVRSRSS
jgi:predicted AAA+ superfamily ATPase